jgi:hypothetical protein
LLAFKGRAGVLPVILLRQINTTPTQPLTLISVVSQLADLSSRDTVRGEVSNCERLACGALSDFDTSARTGDGLSSAQG